MDFGKVEDSRDIESRIECLEEILEDAISADDEEARIAAAALLNVRDMLSTRTWSR